MMNFIATIRDGRLIPDEPLVVNDELKNAIEEKKSISVIEAIAKKQGFKTFHDDAKLKISQHITTVEEVGRVLKLE